MKSFLRFFILAVFAVFIGSGTYFIAVNNTRAAANSQGLHFSFSYHSPIIDQLEVSPNPYNPDGGSASIQFLAKNPPLNSSFDVTITDQQGDLYEAWGGRALKNGHNSVVLRDERLPSGNFIVTVSIKDAHTHAVIESKQVNLLLFRP